MNKSIYLIPLLLISCSKLNVTYQPPTIKGSPSHTWNNKDCSFCHKVDGPTIHQKNSYQCLECHNNKPINYLTMKSGILIDLN